MSESHLQKLQWDNYCPFCIHYKLSTGICQKIYENVYSNPKKFIKKCSAKYFIEDDEKKQNANNKSIDDEKQGHVIEEKDRGQNTDFKIIEEEKSVSNIPVGDQSSVTSKSIIGGLLLVFAGLFSLGITTGDPTNPSIIALFVMSVALIGAIFSFTRKIKIAFMFTIALLAICGIFTLKTLDFLITLGLSDRVSSDAIPVLIFVFFIRGGIGLSLMILAVIALRPGKANSKSS